jgi:20S proteasome alpha/beta subunit
MRGEVVTASPEPAVAGGNVVVLYEPVPRWEDDEDTESPYGGAGHMTLAIGLRAWAQEGIVLVADGRVSHLGLDGHIVVEQDDMVKVFDFGRFGAAFSGFTGLTSKWSATMAALDGVRNAKDVDEADDVIGTWARDYMSRHDNTPHNRRPTCSILLAGYDAKHEPRVYQLHQQRGFESAPFSWVGNSDGAIAAKAVGRLALHGRYPRPSLDVAMLVGVLAVEEAHQEDETVGDPITVAVVTPEYGFRDVSDRLPDLRKKSAALRARLRETVTASCRP